jgi:hypothetical protein
LILVATEGLWAGRAHLTTRAVHSPGRHYACRFPMISRLIAQINADSSRAIAVAIRFAACPCARVTGSARTVWFALSRQSRARVSVRPPPLAASLGSRAADIDNSRPPPQECVAPDQRHSWWWVRGQQRGKEKFRYRQAEAESSFACRFRPLRVTDSVAQACRKACPSASALPRTADDAPHSADRRCDADLIITPSG